MKKKHPKLTYIKKSTPLKKAIFGGFLVAIIVAILIFFFGVLDRFEKPLTKEEESIKIEYLKESLKTEILNSINYKDLNGYNLNLIEVLDEKDRCEKHNCYLFRYSYFVDTNNVNIKNNKLTIDIFISDFVESIITKNN
jgi:hypothetical protein